MQLIEQTIVYSASDLVLASECEFAAARRIDETLGLLPRAELPTDELMERAARLGDVHESRLVDTFVSQHGEGPTGVVRMQRPRLGSLEALRAGQADTVEAARGGAAVIAQAVLFDGTLVGYADFLIRQPDRSCAVADAKLARRAKVRALLQIGAYHDLAITAGIEVSDTGLLLLGSGQVTEHLLPEIVPVVQERRAHLDTLIAQRRASQEPLAWRAPGINACGRCAACRTEVEAFRDVLLIAGMRMTQRAKLEAVGIRTIDDLAGAQFGVAPDAEATHKLPTGIARSTLAGLQAQARLQVRQMAAEAAADAAGEAPAGTPVEFEVIDPAALAAIPAPSEGDIFFDFEGDPLWQDPEGRFGLEYLFGVVEAPTGNEPPKFVPFLAHDRSQERQALIDFMAYVTKRRAQWPEMHIYHYASYERTALKRLVAQHGVCEDELDDLLRATVLVDLFPIVTRSIRVSQPSYSLKKLEPLYMGDQLRSGDVKDAGASVVAYAEYCATRDAAERAGSPDEATAILDGILDYNEYDCVSTLGLRGWLLARAGEHGVAPAGHGLSEQESTVSESAAAEAALAEPLLAWASSDGERTDAQRAVALVGAAVGYHRREDKPYWWGHFERLTADLETLDGDRDTFVVREARVIADWHKPAGRARNHRRVLELVGEMPTGSELERQTEPVSLYAQATEAMDSSADPLARGWREVEVDRSATRTDALGRTVLTVTESVPPAKVYDQLPVALGPAPGPASGTIRTALHEVASQVAAELAGCTPDSPEAVAALPSPAADLLLRRAPRMIGLDGLQPVTDGRFVDPILRAVLALDGSTLSVQGPPGTGKTYVGSHVIARLVNEHGWRVGVVAQSHAVVNHMLDKIVEAGVPAERVGKKDAPDRAAWTSLASNGHGAFLVEHADAGCVLGGTAWDFTNTRRVRRGELDLLVVDEAGQYSLAMTLACSVAAQRLLLLGDPQQLPQVSQGAHPEPVDVSALGWLSDGQTLRPDLGYFLDLSWRMHPDLTERVSVHSYEGRLESKEPETTARAMRDATGAEVPPGVHAVVVPHSSNSTRSVEEAARIVQLVREALTWRWTPSDDAPERPMGPSDVLVVAPYNAQVALLRASLAEAGFVGVQVGTVDKFQGREAPVAIVSMTASAPADVPRGMDFLLSPNRVNVAVSRAQWRAVVVRSEALTDFLPASPEGLGMLGRFLGLHRPHGDHDKHAVDGNDAHRALRGRGPPPANSARSPESPTSGGS
ncbi:MAG: TM0106 family RecB-like putative nuclease [Candidatus Nanopelagicales bacterium]